MNILKSLKPLRAVKEELLLSVERERSIIEITEMKVSKILNLSLMKFLGYNPISFITTSIAKMAVNPKLN